MITLVLNKYVATSPSITVKRISKITIILSIFMIISAAWGLLIFSFMPKDELVNVSSSGTPILLDNLMSVVFKYYSLGAVFQIIMATVLLYAGIQLGKMKAWARTIIELYLWFFVIFNIGFDFLFMQTFFTIPAPVSFKFLSLFMIIFIITLTTLPFLLLIKYMRRKTITSVLK